MVDSVEKIYLKYDNVRPCVECDFGFVKEIFYMGVIYFYKKRDYKFLGIVLALQLSVCFLLLVLAPMPYSIIACLVMIVFINLLFAMNYNMIIIESLLKEGYYPMDYNSSDKLIKKGIYFKLQ